MVKALPSTKDYQDKVKIVGGNLELTGSASEEEKKWAEKIGIEVGVEETVTLKVGDEVTYQNEPFYIIGGDTVGTEISTSTQNLLLFAKYNLTSDGKSQDTSGEVNGCAFSSTAYWSSVSGIAYPADLNDVEKYPIGSATSVITKAQEYGNKIFGVPGKLMTSKEALSLQATYSDILYGKNTVKGYLNYWLSSVNSEYDVWYVYGETRSLSA